MKETRALTEQEKIEWLRLIRSENIGPISFHQLLEKFGSAASAIEQIPELAAKGGAKRAPRIFAKKATEDEYRKLKKLGGQLICSCEPAYPAALRQIHDPPPVLSIIGHSHLLAKPSIAIVGSRNSSAVALRLTERFSEELGKAGFVISSGLARGIDAAAHQAALVNGTIAVVGGGVDISYPKENQKLQQMIYEQGCVIAEQPLGTQPQARHFPRRNRIISGLSVGVLVMEAAPRSGSLITARMALEQGRDVFAIPGSPLDPRAKGTNNLIRNGAQLVESASEIVDALRQIIQSPMREEGDSALPLFQHAPNTETIDQNSRDEIFSLLGPTPCPISDIVHHTNCSYTSVLTILLELELAGRLERHFGNRVSLIE
ncbi:DNA-processing protein DprA [Sneathiella glossodoripedis]|uniref:DNA-processing protein DprA n=1 Tax=Sneathiella glossodoripedis TaxID=418853 RepID=UPI0004725F6E|nr:DNA-processing protein DprA [Sneathiella glossodoripedis]